MPASMSAPFVPAAGLLVVSLAGSLAGPLAGSMFASLAVWIAVGVLVASVVVLVAQPAIALSFWPSAAAVLAECVPAAGAAAASGILVAPIFSAAQFD